jgi:predicted ATPase
LEQALLRQDPQLDWAPPPAVLAAEKATAPVARGNLPIPLTAFIGRQQQLNELCRDVATSRLVTLTGTGGTGKTRLAIETARSLQSTFDDGAWLVDLALLADASGLVDTIASALAVGEATKGSPFGNIGPHTRAAQLDDHLRARHTLVVLDNCEHIRESVALWTQSALASCPRLHVLATSREPLGISGEVQRPVPPLTVPGRDIDDLRELALSEAVQLFEERANRAHPFRLTAESAPAVAGVCRHLDGLPLAIELAAARTKALPVAVIADALVDRFGLLVSTSPTAPARQRTLRATVDWSYQLLDDDERRVFELTSVFDGGCSLDAVKDMAMSAGVEAARIVTLLVGLVDKSLVVPQQLGAATARYDLLETLRAYGRDQLASEARLDDMRRAHRAFFVDMAEQAETGLLSRDYRSWYRRLEQEYANIRAAYESAMASNATDDALRLVSALWWFWATTNRQSEGRAWVDAALAAAGPAVAPDLHAHALSVACYLAGQQLDFDVALAAGERALAIAESTGDASAVAWAQHSLSLTVLTAGDIDRSARLRAEARPVLDAADDHWRVASNDVVACVAALLSGNLDEADTTSAEVLRRAEMMDYEPYRCWSHLLRANLAVRRDDLALAATESERALASAWRLELRHFIAFALTQRGRVSLLEGDAATAEAAFREAIDLAEAMGAPWFAALARVGLAEAYRQNGDDQGADVLVREVVEWSAQPQPPRAVGLMFRVLGGDPVALATALPGGNALALLA